MQPKRLILGAVLAALATVALTGCGGGKSTPAITETAQGAGVALQAAGIYSSQPLHLASAGDLANDAALDSTYVGVEANVYSAQGDQPSIWQFKSTATAASAFKGLHPALASEPGEFSFRCGALLVVGDTSAKVTAARAALVKHFTDCGPVMAQS